ncbi:dual specificity protein phosphatase 1-like [Glandiceps talaboti]
MRNILITMSNTDKNVVSLENNSLANVLQKNIETILLIDCRPFLAYNSSHIATAQNIHCPTILKRRSKGTVALENIVPCKDTRERLRNGDYKTIVAYDLDTLEWESLSKDCNLKLILRSLQMEEELGADLCFLKGGFEKFSLEYPALCVGQGHMDIPQIFLPKTPTNSTVVPDYYSAPVCDQLESQPVEILPFLYLGSTYHSSRKDVLDVLGITTLLNVSTTCPNYFPDDFTYKVVPVDDTSSANISQWFIDAIEFIDSVKVNNGRVLVHCHAGISRSATICLAYLMRALHYRLDDAFEFVKRRRSLISPNFNFMNQLMKFESELTSPRTPRALQNPSSEKFPTSPQKCPSSPSLFGPIRRNTSSSCISPIRKTRRKSTENKENLST